MGAGFYTPDDMQGEQHYSSDRPYQSDREAYRGGPPAPPDYRGGPPVPPDYRGGPPVPPDYRGGPPDYRPSDYRADYSDPYSGFTGESYFDGSGFELLGYEILTRVVSLLTCGIATPWILVKVYEWRISHTVIDGKRQHFNGTGGQLFGNWIKWWLLTLITCGLYGFYLPVALQKWETSHTTYEGSPEMFTSVAYSNSWFEGTFGGFIGNNIICYLLTMVTCGIAYPWGRTLLVRWTTEGERIDGDRYYYEGSGGGMFGEYIICFLLSIITCGIYSSWATCRLNRYIISNTHIAR